MLTPNRNDTGDPGDGHSGHDSIQGLVDALSADLARPVLLHDAALEPIAGSDDADAALALGERLSVPVRHANRTLGYIWLLDPDAELDALDVERAERTARRIAALLGQQAIEPLLDAAPTLTALASSHAGVRAEAIAHVRALGLLPDAPLVCCLVARTAPAVDLRHASERLQQRPSEGFLLAGLLGEEELGLLVAPEDPALGTLRPDDLAQWAHETVGEEVVVGQSALVAGIEAVPEALRQARVALRVAAQPWPGREGHAAWARLGADRLLAQLGETARGDVPEALRRVLREEPELAATLAVFLDSDGDSAQTAAALSLHRSGLYYRLRRFERLTGLALRRSDDRLLAHVAVRLAGYGG